MVNYIIIIIVTCLYMRIPINFGKRKLRLSINKNKKTSTNFMCARKTIADYSNCRLCSEDQY
jgi:hypothetical protein